MTEHVKFLRDVKNIAIASNVSFLLVYTLFLTTQIMLAGDVVGCGYHHSSREIFFTRNGGFLGLLPSFNYISRALTRKPHAGYVPIASAALSSAIRPYIHLDGLPASIQANFGDRPFVFDIKDYISQTVQDWRFRGDEKELCACPSRHGPGLLTGVDKK